MSEPVPVLTIDGPSGSGKGTIAERAARRLGWHLLDSGALYRLVAYAAVARETRLDDEPALAAVARDLDVVFGTEGGSVGRVDLEGEDVSAGIRTEQCGENASRVAAMPSVRDALLERQRAFRRPPGLVADGRDMGTVVFPDAGLKIYLTASLDERAERRYKQLIGKGIGVNLARLVADIAERDQRDQSRDVAPLQAADDAVAIDTTGVDVEVALQRVMAAAQARGMVRAQG